MKRFGQVIQVRPEHIEEYKKYHADVWPGILKKIRECNIRNYSIFLKDNLLFAYFEYTGDNFEGDMQKMADDPETQRWWAVMKPMQEPVKSSKEGEWWSNMEQVFFME